MPAERRALTVPGDTFRRKEARKAQIQGLGYVRSGTMQNRRYRCGKPNSRCVTEGRLHGPFPVGDRLHLRSTLIDSSFGDSCR